MVLPWISETLSSESFGKVIEWALESAFSRGTVMAVEEAEGGGYFGTSERKRRPMRQ
jgi:hypothetical protein